MLHLSFYCVETRDFFNTLVVMWLYAQFLQVYKTVDLIKAKGGKVTREPGPVKGGKTVIAFVEDPDGYKFELIERDPTPEPLCQVMLRVGDLQRSIDFYEKVNMINFVAAQTFELMVLLFHIPFLYILF